MTVTANAVRASTLVLSSVGVTSTLPVSLPASRSQDHADVALGVAEGVTLGVGSSGWLNEGLGVAETVSDGSGFAVWDGSAFSVGFGSAFSDSVGFGAGAAVVWTWDGVGCAGSDLSSSLGAGWAGLDGVADAAAGVGDGASVGFAAAVSAGRQHAIAVAAATIEMRANRLDMGFPSWQSVPGESRVLYE